MRRRHNPALFHDPHHIQQVIDFLDDFIFQGLIEIGMYRRLDESSITTVSDHWSVLGGTSPLKRPRTPLARQLREAVAKAVAMIDCRLVEFSYPRDQFSEHFTVGQIDTLAREAGIVSIEELGGPRSV